MLDDHQIAGIIASEESNAIGYLGSGSTIQKNRDKLLEYYFQEPYGDEQEGQSSVVTSDVSDVVEGMLPSLMHLYTQGRTLGKFEADREEDEQEAIDKTNISNWIFFRQNSGTEVLYSYVKDAITQYTGWMKCYYDEAQSVTPRNYTGLSETELKKLQLDKEIDILDTEEEEDGTYTVSANQVTTNKKYCIVNVPPEEGLINRDARDFIRPRFIGQRTPKTRSELVEMGFDKDTVYSLSSEDGFQTEGEQARRKDMDEAGQDAADKSQETVNLGEYYALIDVDEDGISEYWKIFFAGQQILEKEKVEDHPFGVGIPIPVPHRAIGTCPAEQVAEIQHVKSVLARQMNDNIYQTNYSRAAVNERVDLDDYLSPRAGGAVRVDGTGPIQDSISPLLVQPIVQDILQAIDYWDTTREARTGITRYNQGLDAEALNKTATGFKGLMEASQQRMYLVALMLAETGIKQIFTKIIKMVGRHQSDSMQIKALGKTLEIDPTTWSSNIHCAIDIGTGAGDKAGKVSNLSYVYQTQKELAMVQSPLVDQDKMFNTLGKLIHEVGLKDVETYFNNPQIPEEVLKAENEQAKALLQQIGQQNPLAEAEQVKADAAKEMASLKGQIDMMKEKFKGEQNAAKMAMEMNQFRQEMLLRLSELEMQYNQEIPGVDLELTDDGVLRAIS